MNSTNSMNSITIKATCIIINDRKELLVSEDYDSFKKEYFCVPLGGHVRFGERSEDTLKREFKEEIDAELTNIEPFTVIENFFKWNGKQYHEIDFVYKAELADKSLYHKNDIPFLDSHYPNAKVKWINVNDFKNGKHVLYPEKLKEKLNKFISV